MRLNVKFRDGFSRATASLAVDGRPVWRRDGLTTDLTISFADTVDLEVDGPVVALVATVDGDPPARATVDVAKTPFVECWRVDGRLELRTAASETPIM